MTPLHKQKLREVDAMLQMSPQSLREVSDVRYLFVRLSDIFFSGPNGVQPTPINVIKANNSPLFFELAFAEQMPVGYRLLAELRVEDDRDFAFARVFEIEQSK